MQSRRYLANSRGSFAARLRPICAKVKEFLHADVENLRHRGSRLTHRPGLRLSPRVTPRPFRLMFLICLNGPGFHPTALWHRPYGIGFFFGLLLVGKFPKGNLGPGVGSVNASQALDSRAQP